MKALYPGLALLAMVFLASCVAIQPFPYAVRAGDTITLAIGSLDGVNQSNTTVEFVPDSDPGNPIDVSSGIRSIFNIYPDKKSRSYWDTSAGFGLKTIKNLEQVSGHAAWQTVVAVDLPTTLPTGTGHFLVTLGPGVIYPPAVTKVDNVNIDAEILGPGGSSHTFLYRTYDFNFDNETGVLANLEQLRQVILRTIPDSSTPLEPVAAAEYEINAPIIDAFFADVSDTVPDSDIAVILDDQHSYTDNQTSINWSRTGSTFKVILTSLTGNQNANQIRFSIVLSDYVTAETNGWTLQDTASLISVTYYDIDGNIIPGPTPDVVVQ